MQALIKRKATPDTLSHTHFSQQSFHTSPTSGASLGMFQCMVITNTVYEFLRLNWIALIRGPWTPYSQSTPYRMLQGTWSNAFFKSTLMCTSWETLLKPVAPWRGYTAGPVFHYQVRNHIVPGFSSPVHWATPHFRTQGRYYRDPSEKSENIVSVCSTES